MTISNLDNAQGAHVLDAREPNVIRPAVFGSMRTNSNDSRALRKERSRRKRVAEVRRWVLNVVYGNMPTESDRSPIVEWEATLSNLKNFLPATNWPCERQSEILTDMERLKPRSGKIPIAGVRLLADTGGDNDWGLVHGHWGYSFTPGKVPCALVENLIKAGLIQYGERFLGGWQMKITDIGRRALEDNRHRIARDLAVRDSAAVVSGRRTRPTGKEVSSGAPA